MPKINYAIEIYTDIGDADHTPMALTNTDIGLQNGVFRFVSGRPKYDGSTVVPKYGASEIDINGNNVSNQNNTNIYYEGFLQKDGITSNPSNEIDLSQTGDVATLSSLEFIVSNCNSTGLQFANQCKTDEILFIGRRVRLLIFIDNVIYSRWVGAIDNNPYDEVDFHFSCGFDDSVYKTMPPKIINSVTFPNTGIGSQKSSQISIVGAVSSASNIPANATSESNPLPICFGDIPYAQMFNVEGIPQFEKIAYSSYLSAYSKVAPALQSSNGSGTIDDDYIYSTNLSVQSFNPHPSSDFRWCPGSQFFPPRSLYIFVNNTATGGIGFNKRFDDWVYMLAIPYKDLSISHPVTGSSGDVFTMSATEKRDSYAFPYDYFKDYYVFKVNDTEGYKVVNSYSTWLYYEYDETSHTGRSCYALFLALAKAPESFDTNNMLASIVKGYTPVDVLDYGKPVSGSDTIFFMLGKSKVKQVVSNFRIISYTSRLINGIVPIAGIPVLRSYSSDQKVYNDVSGMVSEANVIGDSTNGGIKFPYLQLKAASEIQENGVSLLTPIVLTKECISNVETCQLIPDSTTTVTKSTAITTRSLTDAQKEILIDRDRTTSLEIAIPGISVPLALDSGASTTTIYVDTDPSTFIYKTGSSGDVVVVGDYTEGFTNGRVVMDYSTTRGTNGYYSVDLDDSVTDKTVANGAVLMIQYVDGISARGQCVTFGIDMTSLVDIDVEKAYFGIDFIATTPHGGIASVGNSLKHLSFGISFRLQDQYGRDVELDSSDRLDLRDPLGNILILTKDQQNGVAAYNPTWNLLPDDYYECGGNTNSETNRFSISSYSDDSSSNAFGEIDFTTVLSLIKTRVATPILYVDFYVIGSSVDVGESTIKPTYPVNVNLKIKQIGFVAQRSISTENKALYTEVKGETIGNNGTTATNTVYTAIRHILEDYDKIPSALISYGNLDSTRDATHSWYIGRQILERKSSLDYLKELCQQAFIGYFISRSGKHSFSAWRENKATSITFDESTIVRGSIKDWKKTDISSMFNDFNLQYNNNPGLGKLDKNIILTHIDDAEPDVTITTTPTHYPGDGFPVIGCIDTDGIPLWKKYCSFPGIPTTPISAIAEPVSSEIGDSYYAEATTTHWTTGNYYVWHGTAWVANEYPAAYTAASTLWAACHESWIKFFIVNQASGTLTSLNWYQDRSVLSDLTEAAKGVGVYSSAYMFLQQIIGWLTDQKDTVTFSVPITVASAQYDLLMPVYFSDYVYTYDVARFGWITRIEPNFNDTDNAVFNISLILDVQ
jgi:hypothetical protein